MFSVYVFNNQLYKINHKCRNSENGVLDIKDGVRRGTIEVTIP